MSKLIFISLRSCSKSIPWHKTDFRLSSKQSFLDPNNLDLKGYLQRIPTPIKEQIISVASNHDADLSYREQSQKTKPFWEHFMLQNHAIWLAKRIFGPKLKNHTVKLLEMTESICCFHMQPIYKKSVSQPNSVLTYSKFKIENYFWHALVSLTTPIWMEWIKLMILCMYAYPHVKNHFHTSYHSLRYSWFTVLNQFGHAWPHPLEPLRMPNYMHKINFKTQFILPKLLYYLASLWIWPDEPGHTQIKWLNKFVVFVYV